jgi:hypothetical protein
MGWGAGGGGEEEGKKERKKREKIYANSKTETRIFDL